MLRSVKLHGKWRADDSQPDELWAPDPRLAHDSRPIPTIHEGAAPHLYSNHTAAGIRYTDEFCMYLGAGLSATREVLMRDYVTAEEFRQLLHWRTISKVNRALRRGVLRGRQPGGRDTAWEIPVRVVLEFMLVNGYLPVEIEEVRQQCVTLTKEYPRQQAS